MFRLGGSAENEGIMDGMRKRYENGAGVQIEGMKPGSTEITMDYRDKPEQELTTERPSFRDILVKSPNLSPFLTEFGLNLLSPPAISFCTSNFLSNSSFSKSLSSPRALLACNL